jgi:hypothetical protein
MKQDTKMGIVSALSIVIAVVSLLAVIVDFAKMCLHEKPMWPPLVPILFTIFVSFILTFRKMVKTHQPGPIENEALEEMLRRKVDKQKRTNSPN